MHLRPLLWPMSIAMTLLACSANDPAAPPQTEKSHENQEMEGWRSPQGLVALDLAFDETTQRLRWSTPDGAERLYNLNPLLLGKGLTLSVLSFDSTSRELTLEVTVTNPLAQDVYDVRGIFTNLGTGKLLNPDDYTKTFDLNRPQSPNPFRAFGKDRPFRCLRGNSADPSLSTASEVFRLQFPDQIRGRLVLSASIPGNVDEPYELSDPVVSGRLYESAGALTLQLEAFDWQDGTAAVVEVESNPVTGEPVPLIRIDETHWQGSLESAGTVPAGTYSVWIAAWDTDASQALYTPVTLTVLPDAARWSSPVLVAGDAGVNEVRPRIVARGSDLFVIYTDGARALARGSTDGGNSWSETQLIGDYANIDTIHAVAGSDDHLYVQYQTSELKYTYTSRSDGVAWETPLSTSYHGMTLPLYSCDFGIGSDGTLFTMQADDWSALGFRSTAPYSIAGWVDDPIATFYNAIYSANDGFVQFAAVPKFFFVHEGTELDYAWYEGDWFYAPLISGSETLLEPAIAPESDRPYHGVMTATDGLTFRLEYFRYDTWPPADGYRQTLATFATQPLSTSISVHNSEVAVIADIDGDVVFFESMDGGQHFAAGEVLAENAAYGHTRVVASSGRVVVAYAALEDGTYNIYLRSRLLAAE